MKWVFISKANAKKQDGQQEVSKKFHLNEKRVETRSEI